MADNFWGWFPTPAENMRRFAASDAAGWHQQGIKPATPRNAGASGLWGTPEKTYEEPNWPGKGLGGNENLAMGQMPYDADVDPEAAAALTNVWNQAQGGGAPQAPRTGGGGGGVGDHFGQYEKALLDWKNRADGLAGEQRAAGDNIRQNQLMPLLGNELQYDLSPLAGLVDNWTGSNMARHYKTPETAQERRGEIGKLQNAIAGTGMQASAKELDALKNLASGRFDIGKARSDQAHRNATLGLQREGLDIDRAKLDIDRMKAGETEMPLEVKTEIAGLANKNAAKTSIANQMRGYLTRYQDAQTEDQKIVIGRQMLKVLNSPEGADAIGVEEAKRLGGLLEYKLFNFTDPGSKFGRDLSEFEDQVIDTVSAVESGVQLNRKRIQQLSGRRQGGTPQAPQASDDAAALAWASANPGDPRAAQILQLNAGAK